MSCFQIEEVQEPVANAVKELSRGMFSSRIGEWPANAGGLDEREYEDGAAIFFCWRQEMISMTSTCTTIFKKVFR